MRGILLATLLLTITACPGVAQQPPANNAIESFALELVVTPQKRTELLAAHPELITPALCKELIRHGNVRFAEAKYAAAFNIYRLAQNIAQQVGDKESVAMTSLNIGSIYYFQGDFELATENYRKAQDLFTAVRHGLGAARSRVGLAMIFQGQGKPQEALNILQQALKEFETLGDKDEIANTLAHIGGIQYELGQYDAATQTFIRAAGLREDGEALLQIANAFYMQRDHAQALAYYDRALNYFTSRDSAAGMISALAGTANCHYYLHNYEEALEFYQRGLAIETRLNDKTGIATRLQSIGNTHRARGDYALALESYLKSLEVAAESPSKGTVATTLGSIGLVRAMQGDNVQALDYFDKSLKEFENNGDPVGMARMLSYIGNVRYAQGLYEQALEAYERSLALYRSKADHLNEAHITLGIGAVYLSQQKYSLALQKYQEAFAVYERLDRKADMADSLSRIAAAHRLQGDHAKALEFANRAATLARGAEVHSLLSHALTEIGRAQRGLKRPNEALIAFDEAIKIQRTTRAEAVAEGLDAERSAVLPYLAAMETLVEQNNFVEAFLRADDAKSQFLRELIQRGNFTITKAMTPQEKKREVKLIGDLVSLKSQVNGAQDSDKQGARAIALRARLDRARVAYEAFRKQLFLRHPHLRVNRGDLAQLRVEDMRSLLSQKSAFLEYAVWEDKVFLFVITPGTQLRRGAPEVHAYQLGVKPAELAERTRRLLQLIATRDKAWGEASRQLYDILLKPAQQQIASTAKLIIIPDQVLWQVPFEALQPAPDRYLLDQTSISYAVSVSVLKEMRKRRPLPARGRPESQTVLAFGNPVLSEEVIKRLETTYRELPLKELVSETDQIDKLQTVYGKARSRFYSGANATKEEARTEAASHSVLHFAVPAILDHSAPMHSFLLLSSDARDDGLLKLWEVTNLNSKLRVAVLSNSIFARHDLPSGNALIALSWAWFVAGTPAVVLSRSSMDSPVVIDLHRNLRTQPQSQMAESLRQSALKIRRSPGQEHPHYWSGLMYLGH